MNKTTNGIRDYEDRMFSEEDVVKISYLLRNIWDKRETKSGVKGEGVFGEWLYLYYPEIVDELLQKELKETGFLNEINNTKNKPDVDSVDWKLHVKFKKSFLDLTKEMIENGCILVRDLNEKFNRFIINMKDFEYYKDHLNQIFDIKIIIEQTPKEWLNSQFNLEDGLTQLKQTYHPSYLENILKKYFVEIEGMTGYFSDILYEEFNWLYDDINDIKKYDIKLFMKIINLNYIEAPSSLSNDEYLVILKDFLGSNLKQSEKYDMLFNDSEELWNNVLFDRVVNNGILPNGIVLHAYTPKEFKREFSEDIKEIEKELK